MSAAASAVAATDAATWRDPALRTAFLDTLDYQASTYAMLGDYAISGFVAPTSTGSVMVARDPGLDRPVWVHCGAVKAESRLPSA